MSSGGKGNSKARTDSTQNTTNTQETTNNVDNRVWNTNVSQTDSRIFSTVDDRQQNTTTTNNTTIDAGAVKSAFGFGTDALTANKAAIGSALDFGSNALDFGTNALNKVASLNSDSLNLLQALASGAIDNSKTLARDAMDSNAASTKAAINGFQALATQNSQSSDDRLQKVVQYALVAIAAIMILPRLFSGSNKGAAFA